MAKTRTSWQPGQTGNPDGRPRGEILNGLLWEVLSGKIKTGRNKGRVYWDVILDQLSKKAAQGSPWAVTFCIERFCGKPTAQISGKIDGPVQVIFDKSFDGV